MIYKTEYRMMLESKKKEKMKKLLGEILKLVLSDNYRISKDFVIEELNFEGYTKLSDIDTDEGYPEGNPFGLTIRGYEENGEVIYPIDVFVQLKP